MLIGVDVRTDPELRLSGAASWDLLLDDIVKRSGFDASTFLNALSAVAGVLLAIPFLAPLVRFLTYIFRRTIEKLTSRGAIARRRSDLHFIDRLRAVARQEIRIEQSPLFQS